MTDTKPLTKTVGLSEEAYQKFEQIRASYRPMPSRRILFAMLVEDKYEELLADRSNYNGDEQEEHS